MPERLKSAMPFGMSTIHRAVESALPAVPHLPLLSLPALADPTSPDAFPPYPFPLCPGFPPALTGAN